MGAASHLGIRLADYDRAIRTLIPHYEELVDAVAAVVDAFAPRAPAVVDLGIGSGALAARVSSVRPRARVTGIDADAAMLVLARKRLGSGLRAVHADFERAALPRCNLITASFALHHIGTRRRKASMYARCFAALRPGGVLVIGDVCLASNPRLRAADRAGWMRHLKRRYSPAKAAGFLRAWAKEDVYFTLDAETSMLEAAGFVVDVAWRRDHLAVIVGRRRR